MRPILLQASESHCPLRVPGYPSTTYRDQLATMMAAETYILPDMGAELHQHNYHFSMQKYLLLQEQHDSLRQHLDQLYPIGTAVTSPTASPTRVGYSPASVPSSPTSSRSSSISRNIRSNHRRSSLPAQQSNNCGYGTVPCSLQSILDESTLAELALEEARLSDVNEGIKRALTELLNCEAVRADRAMRNWVQCRLMDTERELRLSRRRRSSSGADF